MSAPACNLDAEANVLGAILCAGSLGVDDGHRVLDRVYATGLMPDDFYVASHGALFATLVRLRLKGWPLDCVSVADAIENDGFGAAASRGRLERLAHEVVAFSPAVHWARIVQREARRRRAEVAGAV